MKREPIDGRTFVPELMARTSVEGKTIELRSPGVGLWREGPRTGAVVQPGGELGVLEVLGVLHRVRVPADAAGLVLERPGSGPRLARRAVGFDDVLVMLDPEASPSTAGVGATVQQAGADAGGPVFRSPLSGRFYARSAPDQPPFVQVGAVVETGQTVALLEVMKTFNRVTYPGESGGLPARAKVVAIGPADEDDVDEGDVLLRLEGA